MHAVRGTIGHDPEATARAEGRAYNPTTKQLSRERFFADRAETFSEAAKNTAGGIERNAERTADQRRVESGVKAYDKALAHLDGAIAELDAPLTTAAFPAYGISD